MYIKSLKVVNFKGFSDDNNYIEFNIPNGNDLGSGLNILIGENNCGKSTILEAIDFVRNGTKKTPESFKYKNSYGEQLIDAEIILEFVGKIEDVIDNFAQSKKSEVFKSRIYQCGKGLSNLKIRRTTKDSKSLEIWNESENVYKNDSGIDAPLKKLFETNFIWADTNPNDEASFGTTTICGYLLAEIVKNHKETIEYQGFNDQFHNIFNSDQSELRQQLVVVQTKIKEVFESQFGLAEIAFEFEEVKIESFFKNMRIMIDDGIKVPMSEKGNGMQRSIALALIQVYAQMIAFDSDLKLSKPFFLFIDEPELCLHPKGQDKLFNALLKISKHRQVFVITHSPYFLNSPYLSNTGLFIFKKDQLKNIIKPASLNYLFPWSPTWGEINFRAYDLPTVDFHNELYGYLQDRSKRHSESKFEEWLSGSKGIDKSKTWIRESDGMSKKPYAVTLMTFIRNHIHHPENLTMRLNTYTNKDLSNSINKMISLIEQLEADITCAEEELDLA